MPRNTQISVTPNTRSADFLKENNQPRDTPYALLLGGNFNGATVTVELSVDESTTSTSLIVAKDPFTGDPYAATGPDAILVPAGVEVYLSMSYVGSGQVFGKLV